MQAGEAVADGKPAPLITEAVAAALLALTGQAALAVGGGFGGGQA